MGALGLNGATNSVAHSRERPVVASAGWARWAPVNAAAIGHLVVGAGLIPANRSRVAHHSGPGANTAIKAALTGVAVATTVWSGINGTKVTNAGAFPAVGAVVSSNTTPAEIATAQQQLRIAQWVTPAVTAVLIVLGAQQGELQRSSQLLGSLLSSPQSIRPPLNMCWLTPT